MRVEADVPPRTSISLAVSTSEIDPAPDQGNAAVDVNWSGFAAGLPHPSDWSEETGAHDFLIQGQPPGRYLYLRLRLSGPGTATPRVRRIQLDFPRATNLDFPVRVFEKCN